MKSTSTLSLIYLYFVLFIICSSTYAQDITTQVVRGTVEDKSSHLPIEAVEVYLKSNNSDDTTSTYSDLTDANGKFRIENVKVGRYKIEFHYLGFKSIVKNNLIITSAKEVVLDIEMESTSQQLQEVKISASNDGDARNEMAMVSAREFSVAETNRYAGSRGEPARMASNYAGVQGADDSRNDIIIRGNAPSGLLWRLEGVNIPNPNHFSIAGTSGGPVTILNNAYLANSDFFTGAFPAEYGNALAGVFDLRMRNGNNESHEFSAKLGFLGTEARAEGPIKKENGSSYLATYRYSTLSLFEFLNIRIGTDAIPRYQDAALRLNFPLNKKMNISVFGIGGKSDIDIILSDLEAPSDDLLLYGSNDRDQYFGSQMGVMGVSFSHSIDKKTYMETTVAASNQEVYATHYKIVRHVNSSNKFVYDSIPNILDYNFRNNRYSLTSFITNKLNDNFKIKSGFIGELYAHNFIDSVRIVTQTQQGEYNFSPWMNRWNTESYSTMLQAYSQFKWHAADRLTITAGINAMGQGINDNFNVSIEPRGGLTYRVDEKQSINFGIGLHSQQQPFYLYYYKNSNNEDMELSKSLHFVLGHDYKITPTLRLKTETYYQHLYHIPVEKESSSFSLVNAGSGFSRLFPGDLVNKGIGRNYGIEFTLEKYFFNQYYFLITASLFDSKYQGSDGVWRNTTYNGQYALNGLFAYEFILSENLSLNAGGKITYVGGRWYGEVDKDESRKVQEIVYKDATLNTKQFKPYFRVDTKLSLRWNQEKVTHEISLDLVNIFNIRNILALTYAPDHPSGEPIKKEYQLGFLPVFFYKIDF